MQERLENLRQAVGMLAFLLVPQERFSVEGTDAEAVLGDEAVPALTAAIEVLEGLQSWRTDDIQETLRSALVEGLGLKPKFAYAPIRVAVTGRRVSPPLFESMEILGKQACLARLDEARRR